MRLRSITMTCSEIFHVYLLTRYKLSHRKTLLAERKGEKENGEIDVRETWTWSKEGQVLVIQDILIRRKREENYTTSTYLRFGNEDAARMNMNMIPG